MRLRILLLSLAFTLSGLGEDNPVRVLDGGIGRGTLESIFIPPMAHALFSLVLATEWSRLMNNGGAFTQVNQRRIMREGKGRIYQERWLLVPKGSKIKSEMNVVQISDSHEKMTYNCMVAEKTCYVIGYSGSDTVVYKPVIGVTGPLPSGNGTHLHEELGTSSSAGVNTTGYRETTTLGQRSANGNCAGVLVFVGTEDQPDLEAGQSADGKADIYGDGIDDLRARSTVLHPARRLQGGRRASGRVFQVDCSRAGAVGSAQSTIC